MLRRVPLSVGAAITAVAAVTVAALWWILPRPLPATDQIRNFAQDDLQYAKGSEYHFLRPPPRAERRTKVDFEYAWNGSTDIGALPERIAFRRSRGSWLAIRTAPTGAANADEPHDYIQSVASSATCPQVLGEVVRADWLRQTHPRGGLIGGLLSDTSASGLDFELGPASPHGKLSLSYFDTGIARSVEHRLRNCWRPVAQD